MSDLERDQKTLDEWMRKLVNSYGNHRQHFLEGFMQAFRDLAHYESVRKPMLTLAKKALKPPAPAREESASSAPEVPAPRSVR